MAKKKKDDLNALRARIEAVSTTRRKDVSDTLPPPALPPSYVGSPRGQPTLQRILRKHDLVHFTGLKRTAIDEAIKNGEFPKPVIQRS
jgi:hypothetical protein